MYCNESGEIVPPVIRNPYNYDADLVSETTGLFCTDPTLAQQQFAEEVDINTIVERFGLTGQLPVDQRVPINAEFLDIMDYRSALDQLREADEAFMAFPANIRERFSNDAGKFVDFVSDPANLQQCRDWGIANPAPPAPPPDPGTVTASL